MSRIDRLIPWFLGLVFIVAGVMKVLDPTAFAVSIARLRMAPMLVVGPAAILLPWVEIVTGVALCIPRAQVPALKLLLGLLVILTGILAIATARGTAHACGCFGSSDSFFNRPDLSLVRNLPLIALAAKSLRSRLTCPAGPASPA